MRRRRRLYESEGDVDHYNKYRKLKKASDQWHENYRHHYVKASEEGPDSWHHEAGHECLHSHMLAYHAGSIHESVHQMQQQQKENPTKAGAKAIKQLKRLAHAAEKDFYKSER